MSRPINRCWIGRCQYPDRKPFLLGTVEAESEMQAVVALQRLWASISPHPCPALSAEPGFIIVQRGDD